MIFAPPNPSPSLRLCVGGSRRLFYFAWTPNFAMSCVRGTMNSDSSGITDYNTSHRLIEPRFHDNQQCDVVDPTCICPRRQSGLKTGGRGSEFENWGSLEGRRLTSATEQFYPRTMALYRLHGSLLCFSSERAGFQAPYAIGSETSLLTGPSV